ncbi:MAG: A/G-specific adenine glycosylase [Acidobacteriota bacterium]
MRREDAEEIGRALLRWYRRNRRDLPWRGRRDPYRVWVSEVMLQQTTVRAVIPYYRRFLRRFPSLRSLACASDRSVLASWSGLGYYRRALNLRAAAAMIIRRHGGRFPRELREALALPGVGRSTAGAVLSIAFGRRLPVLDGNIVRVLSRLALLRGATRGGRGEKRLWGLAGLLVERTSSPGELNQALMELGATLCTPVGPACRACPLARRCAARAAGLQDAIPTPRRRRAAVVVRSRLALVTRAGRHLMRRRRGTGLLDGTWEFPTMASRPRRDGLRLRSQGRIATIRHTITYRRMLVDVHRARLLAEPRGGAYRWLEPERIRRLPVSSLVLKVLGSVSGEV